MISRQKYILYILKETRLLGFRLVDTNIEISHRLDKGSESPSTEIGRYQ